MFLASEYRTGSTTSASVFERLKRVCCKYHLS